MNERKMEERKMGDENGGIENESSLPASLLFSIFPSFRRTSSCLPFRVFRGSPVAGIRRAGMLESTR
jgi:hypothetical protein